MPPVWTARGTVFENTEIEAGIERAKRRV